MSATDFPLTLEALHDGIDAQLQLGAQVYVSIDGETLLDDAIGLARHAVPMQRDSLTAWFCAGKPLTAVAIARLVDKGDVTVTMRVGEVVDGFACGGKEAITLQHLLTHTAGFGSDPGARDILLPPAR